MGQVGWSGLTILQEDGTLQNYLGPAGGGDDVDDDDDDGNVDDDEDEGDVDDDGVEQINIEISFFSAAAGLLCAAMG